jgi:hypothetical protein
LTTILRNKIGDPYFEWWFARYFGPVFLGRTTYFLENRNWMMASMSIYRLAKNLCVYFAGNRLHYARTSTFCHIYLHFVITPSKIRADPLGTRSISSRV